MRTGGVIGSAAVLVLACACGGEPPASSRGRVEPDVAASPAHAAPTGLGPSAARDAAGWRAMASRAEDAELLLPPAERALDRLEPARRAEVEAMLHRVASLGSGADGLRAAGALAVENTGTGNDPDWAGSGTPAGSAAMQAGSLAVLAGRVSAAAREPGADPAALLEALDTMPLPAPRDGGGHADDRPYRSQLAAELRYVIGREAFAALRERRPGPAPYSLYAPF